MVSNFHLWKSPVITTYLISQTNFSLQLALLAEENTKLFTMARKSLHFEVPGELNGHCDNWKHASKHPGGQFLPEET